MSHNLFLTSWKILGEYGVYMEVRRDLRGTFYLHLIHPHAIQDISDTIIYRFYIGKGIYIWYPNTFPLYRHLIRKHRWFFVAMKKRIFQALYFLFWWFLKSTFNNLWRYSHIIFFRERIPQYRYTRRSVFLQIPITFIHNFLICPIPAFNLISVYHYSQHWANFVSNNTGIAEYIKIQALKVSCFQFVSNWDFWCEGSH